MKYSVPFNDTKERDSIRKWAGRTRGVSIIKSDEFWYRSSRQIDSWTIEWGHIYIIEVKNIKAEMLIKLQFPNCFLYDGRKYNSNDIVTTKNF